MSLRPPGTEAPREPKLSRLKVLMSEQAVLHLEPLGATMEFMLTVDEPGIVVAIVLTTEQIKEIYDQAMEHGWLGKRS